MGPMEVYGATGYGTSIYVPDPDGYMMELKANYSQFPVKTSVNLVRATATHPR